MKIYVDYTTTTSLNKEGFFKLKNEFKSINWTGNIEDS